MKFGTLQNITKEPQLDDELDREEDFDDFEGFEDEELDLDGEMDLEDELETGLDDVTQSLKDKLLGLKREIDEILSDMGYGEDEEFDASGFDDEEFNFASGEAESDGAVDDAEFAFGDDDMGNTEDSEEGEEIEGEDSEDGLDLFGDEEGLGSEDPDFQGDIRTVKGADLVYKRKTEDGNFEELWIYNVGSDIRQETQIRKAILAGTDIVPSQRESEDGTQHAETSTLGNVQYLRITGLPN